MQFFCRLLPFSFALLTACGGQSQSSAPAPLPNQLHATVVATDYTTVVQQLYIAYFGRPADTGGLANFQQRMANLNAPTTIEQLDAAYRNNAALRELVDSFSTSDESKALYAGGSTKDFITAIYRNILNRTPDAEGLAYWADEIDKHGLSRANASLSIMAGALSNTTSQGKLDAALVGNKVAVSTSFVDAIARSSVNGYAGDAAAAQARAMLSNISSTSTASSYQTTITNLVSSLTIAAGGASTGVTITPALANYRHTFFGMAAGSYIGKCGTFKLSPQAVITLPSTSAYLALPNSTGTLSHNAATGYRLMGNTSDSVSFDMNWDTNGIFKGLKTTNVDCDILGATPATSLPSGLDIGTKVASVMKAKPGSFTGGTCYALNNGNVSVLSSPVSVSVNGNSVTLSGTTFDLSAPRVSENVTISDFSTSGTYLPGTHFIYTANYASGAMFSIEYSAGQGAIGISYSESAKSAVACPSKDVSVPIGFKGLPSTPGSTNYHRAVFALAAGNYIGKCGPISLSSQGSVTTPGASQDFSLDGTITSFSREGSGYYLKSGTGNAFVDALWEGDGKFTGLTLNKASCNIENTTARTALQPGIDIAVSVASLMRDLPGSLNSCFAVSNDTTSSIDGTLTFSLSGNRLTLHGMTVDMSAPRMSELVAVNDVTLYNTYAAGTHFSYTATYTDGKQLSLDYVAGKGIVSYYYKESPQLIIGCHPTTK